MLRSRRWNKAGIQKAIYFKSGFTVVDIRSRIRGTLHGCDKFLLIGERFDSEIALHLGDLVVRRLRVVLQGIGEGVIARAGDGLRARANELLDAFVSDKPVIRDLIAVLGQRLAVVIFFSAAGRDSHVALLNGDGHGALELDTAENRCLDVDGVFASIFELGHLVGPSALIGGLVLDFVHILIEFKVRAEELDLRVGHSVMTLAVVLASIAGRLELDELSIELVAVHAVDADLGAGLEGVAHCLNSRALLLGPADEFGAFWSGESERRECGHVERRVVRDRRDSILRIIFAIALIVVEGQRGLGDRETVLGNGDHIGGSHGDLVAGLVHDAVDLPTLEQQTRGRSLIGAGEELRVGAVDVAVGIGSGRGGSAVLLHVEHLCAVGRRIGDVQRADGNVLGDDGLDVERGAVVVHPASEHLARRGVALRSGVHISNSFVAQRLVVLGRNGNHVGGIGVDVDGRLDLRGLPLRVDDEVGRGHRGIFGHRLSIGGIEIPAIEHVVAQALGLLGVLEVLQVGREGLLVGNRLRIYDLHAVVELKSVGVAVVVKTGMAIPVKGFPVVRPALFYLLKASYIEVFFIIRQVIEVSLKRQPFFIGLPVVLNHIATIGRLIAHSFKIVIPLLACSRFYIGHRELACGHFLIISALDARSAQSPRGIACLFAHDVPNRREVSVVLHFSTVIDSVVSIALFNEFKLICLALEIDIKDGGAVPGDGHIGVLAAGLLSIVRELVPIVLVRKPVIQRTHQLIAIQRADARAGRAGLRFAVDVGVPVIVGVLDPVLDGVVNIGLRRPVGREGHGLRRQALERLKSVALVPTCEVVARALGLEGGLDIARLISPCHNEEGIDGRAAGAVEGHPAAVGHLRVDLHRLGTAELGPLGEGDCALGIGVPSGEALGGGLDEGLGRRRGGGCIDGLALGARLSPQNVLAPEVHEVDVADLLKGRRNLYCGLLGRVRINGHAGISQIEDASVHVLPSDELESVLGGSRGGHKRFAPLDLLGINEFVSHIELVGDGHLLRSCHHVDGEVLDVEGLDVDLGLAGVDLGHGRSVVGHMVDGHVLALEVRVEEADVHLAVGLDLPAVLDEGHVDGLVAVEGLALLGHGLLDGLAVFVKPKMNLSLCSF